MKCKDPEVDFTLYNLCKSHSYGHCKMILSMDLVFFCFSWEHKRCVVTWLVFLSSRDETSQSGIKPSTTPFDFRYLSTILESINGLSKFFGSKGRVILKFNWSFGWNLVVLHTKIISCVIDACLSHPILSGMLVTRLHVHA